MSLPTFIVPVSESSDFTPVLVPEGTHFARIYKIIDLGTHEDSYQGVTKGAKRVFRIYFEFPKIKHTFKEELGEQPLAMSKEFKMSFTSKDAATHSGLTKLVNSVGDNGHDRHYNVFNLLGKTTQLKIEHNTSESNGKTYANIKDYARLSAEQIEMAELKPENYKAVNEQKFLYLLPEYFSWEDYEAQPDYIKEKIQLSPEFAYLSKNKKSVTVEKLNEGVELPDVASIDVDELNIQMPF